MGTIHLLAKYAHNAWASWMTYLFSKCYEHDNGDLTIPAEYVKNLRKQMNTAYEHLSESEAELDRDEAHTILKLLETSEYFLRVESPIAPQVVLYFSNKDKLLHYLANSNPVSGTHFFIYSTHLREQFNPSRRLLDELNRLDQML